jgi:hypothetical protein
VETIGDGRSSRGQHCEGSGLSSRLHAAIANQGDRVGQLHLISLGWASNGAAIGRKEAALLDNSEEQTTTRQHVSTLFAAVAMAAMVVLVVVLVVVVLVVAILYIHTYIYRDSTDEPMLTKVKSHGGIEAATQSRPYRNQSSSMKDSGPAIDFILMVLKALVMINF